MSINFTRENDTARKFGTHEISISACSSFGNPYLNVELKVCFTRPDGTKVTVDGFYDGGSSFKARAYCDREGQWQWNSQSNHSDLTGKSGSFYVIPSVLKGKLKVHPEDSRQFAYENNEWFLHIGDTGYRYLADVEENWKEYIDQAVISGITKIRAWFCQGRSDIQGLFQNDRKYLNLKYWQEMDRRIIYALNNHPQMILQLLVYGEDGEEIRRYAEGNPASALVAQYAQARFAAFGNIQWCISNDLLVDGGKVIDAEREGQTVEAEKTKRGIQMIGRDMAEREPWGTLITNHQCRFSGYSFTDEEWSEIVTIEDLGQVRGEKILEYRSTANCPVVLDEDRYEHWRSPKHDRYFFRRLMWASLLSGGHATYGGLKTFEIYDGGISGMYGYYDACRDGKLEEGAHDFIFIHKFFKDTGITLVKMIPDDAAAGNKPLLYKVTRSKDKDRYIVYLANPDVFEGHCPSGFGGCYTDEYADAGRNIPSVSLDLPQKLYSVGWFNPTSGIWVHSETVEGGECSLTAPSQGDWILLLISKREMAGGEVLIGK